MKKQIMMAAMLSSVMMTAACTAPYQTIHADQPAQPVRVEVKAPAYQTQGQAQVTQGQLPAANNLQYEGDRLRLLSKLSFYPRPKARFNRHVIYLPKADNERNMKVELIIGTHMQTDCNYYQLIGDFQKKTLYGWGYTYYELGKLKGPMSTMINCPTTRKTTTFLRVVGTEEHIPYNSDVPIVVYTPSGLEVSYRIWLSNDDRQFARVE